MKVAELTKTLAYGPAPEAAKPALDWIAEHNAKFQLFINNEWKNPSGKEWFDSMNPATGKKLASIAQATAADVSTAVKAARKAYPSWSATPGHIRARYLYAIARQIQKHSRLFAVLETLDNGKPIRETRDIDIPLVARHFYYHAGWAQLMDKELPDHQSLGVVAQIIPWNFPLLMLSWKIAPAIAMGNTVVLKPAEFTSLTALLFAEICASVGLPPGVVNIITGDGRTGSAMVDHPDVDKIAFTGSTDVGRIIRKATAGTHKKLSLELGGKNAMLVLDDADPMDAASKAVYACFTSMGQLCVSIERIYVDRRVAEVFIPEFARKTRALVLGSAFDYSTDVGSLTSAAQLERITAKVGDAVAKGATVLAGGKARPELGPYFFEPTVLTNVTPAMECFAAETFGPVVAVTIVDSEAEAIAAANDTEFGLNASVFTGSVARGRRVADQLNTGSVNINEGYRGSFGSVDAPMGGMKKSGLGRRNGVEGMTRFVDARTVAELTGLLALPTTGRHFERLVGPLVLLAKVLKAIRRA